jgi:magnesium transporter
LPVLRILIRHTDGRVETPSDLASLDGVLADPQSLVWVDAEAEPRETLEALAARFALHPVTPDDFVNGEQRPKIEEFDQHVFVVIHALLGIRADDVEIAEIHAALGHSNLLTVHDRPLDMVSRIFDRCRGDLRILQGGPSFLLYVLVPSPGLAVPPPPHVGNLDGFPRADWRRHSTA